MRHVGFTGTRGGLTVDQGRELRAVLLRLYVAPSVFHFGDCVGADEAGARCAEDLGYLLHSHPQTNRGMRAFMPAFRVEEPRPPLDRNRDIVAAVRVVVACPAETREQLRSGTWATVRYAREALVPVVFVFPDGRTCVDFNLLGSTHAW